MSIELLIEDKILLKRVARSWTPKGWGPIPLGWTPDDTNEWVQDETDRAMAANEEKGLLTARILQLQKAALAYGGHLYPLKRPWPGWVPVVPREDRRIVRAYVKIFKATGERLPDGKYEFRNGKIQKVDKWNTEN